MKVYATDGREYWTLRKLRCSGCGEMSRHYEVSWDAQNAPQVFGVPYAGANGGIQREVGVPEEWPEEMRLKNVNECEVYLSQCCDSVYGNKDGYAFGDVGYQCPARSGVTRCRLNAHLGAHPSSLHLGPYETPYERDISRVWTMPTAREQSLRRAVMDPHIVTAENAEKVWGWLQERGGIACWSSANLSNPGASWTTPRLTADGAEMTKPTWQAEAHPSRIITDPAEVLVSTDVEVKRFRVAVRRGAQGMMLKCTDASTRRIRTAVERAGTGAYYVFDYTMQEAVILKPMSQMPIAEYVASRTAEVRA